MMNNYHKEVAGMVEEIPTRKEVPEALTWDLQKIFYSDEEWEIELKHIKEASQNLTQFVGHVGESSQTLQTTYEAILAVNRSLEKVYVYAHQKFDQDTSNQKYAAYNDRVQSLWAEVSAAEAFFEPEVLALPQSTLQEYMDSKSLAQYQHYFDTLLKQKPHILSADQEALLAGASDIFGASEQTFSVFDNADLTFGLVHDNKGREIQLTNGLYSRLLESKDRDVRREAFETLYDSYIRFQNTLASTLSSHIKGHNYLAKVRQYDNARQAAVSRNHIPESVFTTLIDSVHDHLPLLHRFVTLRKKVLPVEDVHSYDLYTPLVKSVDFDVNFEEAKAIVLRALAPLGEDYIKVVKQAFDERWIDVVENKGKRSGAYSGGAYDTVPYILLNWQNNLNNVYTLAHEMGHSVHSYFTRTNQGYHYGDYPIFLAEIASTTNESLLTDYLLSTNDDPNFRAYVLNQYLDGFKGTVFRQTQFAEFEDWLHQTAAAGQALTAETLSDFYMALNQKYYGADLFPDEEIAYEWSRIPHFYYDYYVYQYATGEAAATTLAEGILESDQAEAYKQFLKSGSSKYPLDVMKAAGVDMSQKDYLNQAFNIFEQRLNELEQLLLQ